MDNSDCRVAHKPHRAPLRWILAVKFHTKRRGTAHLPLPLCQVRDVLCYVHSTAWILARVQALPQAQAAWQQALAQWSPPVQQALAATQQRLGLLGKLPRSRRLGRDALRLRMAWALLAGNNV